MKSVRLVVTYILVCVFLLVSISSTAVQGSGPRDSSFLYFPLLYNESGYKMVGPSGGNIENLVIDPLNTDIMYTGSWGSGVYKSVDEGANWSISSKGLENPYVYCLVIDQNNPLILYAGTYGDGVYKSIDGAANWFQVSSGMNLPLVVYTLEIDPADANVIYAGIRDYYFLNYNDLTGGVYKTTDGGLTWQKKNNGLPVDYIYDIKVDPTHPDIVYAAMHQHGIYKSYDAGESWVAKNVGLAGQDWFKGRSIVIDPQNPDRLFFGTWGYNSVYKSENGAETWSIKSTGMQGDTKVWELTMDQENPAILYASIYSTNYEQSGLYKTTNGGQSWSPMAKLSDFHTSLVIHPHDHQTLFTSMKATGLWKSTDGGYNWVISHNGIQAHNVVSALNDPNNPNVLYISAYGNGLWKSVDNGMIWTAINSGLPTSYIHTIVFDPSNPNHIYAGTQGNGVYYSDNGGASWTARNVNMPTTRASDLEPALGPPFDHPQSMLWFEEALDDFMLDPEEQLRGAEERVALPSVYTISINPVNPNIVIIGTSGKGILRSFDGGATWQSTSYGAQTMLSSVIDSGTPLRAYMGMSYPDSLARSIESTLYTWVLSNSGIKNQKVNALVIGNAGSNILYAGTSDDPASDMVTGNGVFKSLDYGDNWSYIGLFDYPVTSMLNHPLNTSGVFAGTTDGLFLSRDGGATWQLYDGSIWNQKASCLSEGYGNNLLLMGTDGGNLIVIKR